MTNALGEPLRALFQDTLEMLSQTRVSFRRHDPVTLDGVDALARSVHRREKELTQRLLASGAPIQEWRFVPGHLERIGDAVEGLTRCVRTMEAEGTVFTERGVREVNTLFEKATELLECARDLVLTGNRVLARHLEAESGRFHELADEYARAHEERLIKGVCMPRASSAYLAILDYLREVARHTRRIGDRVTAQPAV